MKTTLIVLLALFSFQLATAQPDCIRQLAAATADLEDQSTFNLSGSWLSAITSSKDENILSHLDKLSYLGLPADAAPSFGALANELSSEGYEILTETRSGGSRSQILILENSQGITDLVILATSDEGLSAITISGLIIMDELDDLDVDIDGWDDVQRSKRD